MKYKAVIFDLDGVICHTDRFHYLAWKKISDRIGVPFDESTNNRLRGVGRAESLEIILKLSGVKMPQPQKEEYLKEKNALYREYLKTMSPEDVAPAVRDTLKTVKTMGIKSAIGSSSKNARYILKQIGLYDWFDAIADGTNITRPKPDPEVFIKASSLLGIAPKDCLVVEDGLPGIAAAAAAGMDSAAVGDAARAHIASYDLDDIAALIPVLK